MGCRWAGTPSDPLVAGILAVQWAASPFGSRAAGFCDWRMRWTSPGGEGASGRLSSRDTASAISCSLHGPAPTPWPRPPPWPGGGGGGGHWHPALAKHDRPHPARGRHARADVAVGSAAVARQVAPTPGTQPPRRAPAAPCCMLAARKCSWQRTIQRHDAHAPGRMPVSKDEASQPSSQFQDGAGWHLTGCATVHGR